MGFSSERDDKPYNEHPVTIYPGPVLQFTRQVSPKLSPGGGVGDATSPKSRLPPRTLAGSMERHREVCRDPAEDSEGGRVRGRGADDEEHFSDDSLEESFPPPPPPPAVTTPNKRNSIAWEVSLDGDDPLLMPGSTKVNIPMFPASKVTIFQY